MAIHILSSDSLPPSKMVVTKLFIYIYQAFVYLQNRDKDKSKDGISLLFARYCLLVYLYSMWYLNCSNWMNFLNAFLKRKKIFPSFPFYSR